MKELIINAPVSEIDFQKRNSVKKKKDKSLILDKLSDYVLGIYVNNTIIKNGQLHYNYISKTKKSGFFNTAYSFELSNLSVDSATFHQSDKLFFAENFKFELSDLNLQLANNTHRLKVNKAKFSSEGQTADILDLKVIPTTLSNDSTSENEVFDFYFPRIKLSGANLHQAFFNKELYIYNFTIFDPVFNIEKIGKWAHSANEKDDDYENKIYSLISDYATKIRIKNLSMDNGKLNLKHSTVNKSTFELSNLFSVKLTNFEIDKNSTRNKNKLFFSDDIDLILKEHSFALADGVHKVDADEIGIISSKKQVYVKNARLYPTILSEGFKKLPVSIFATIPEIQISDADIFGLFNEGILPVNKVVLNQPQIKILFQPEIKLDSTLKQKPIFISEQLKHITANKISIKNGHLELANYEDFKSNTFIKTNVDFDLENFKITHKDNNFNSSYSDFNVKLTNSSYDLPDNIHALKIDQINYQLQKEKLTIKQLSISPLNTISKKEKHQFITINLPETTLSNFNFENYLSSNQIRSTALFINKPIIEIQDNRIENKNVFSPYNLNIYKSIKDITKGIYIDRIALNNMSFHQHTNTHIDLTNINITTDKFIVDENKTNNTKLFNCNSVDIKLNNYKFDSKDKIYTYNFDKISINEKGDFNIENFTIAPLVTEMVFAKRKKYQADYLNLSNTSIAGTSLDIKELFENKNLFVNTLTLKTDNIEIFRNKRKKLNPTIIKRLPQQLLRDLEWKIDIKNTNLTIDKINYSELEKRAINKGNLWVTNCNAKINNITNIERNIDTNQFMDISISGNMMDEALTTVDLKMDLHSFSNDFSCKLICESMPLASFNPITESSLKLSIKEGTNRKLQAEFEANEDSAVGNIKFAYNDLKISVLNTKGGEVKEGKLLSFLVNSIALKTDNPKAGRIILPSKIEYHRDKKRSVVGYCWQSIFSGIKSTMGIKKKEPKK